MMNFSEMPLVLFTTFSQMAVGAWLMLQLLVRKERISARAARACAMVIFVLTALAMGCSTLHLGDPLGAYRALLGIGHSWLSREILIFGGFFALTFLYLLPQIKGSLRQLVGFGGSVAGILGIVITAMVYTLPARPAWDSIFPLLFFLLTAFTAGPLLITVIVRSRDNRLCHAGLKMTSCLLLAGAVTAVTYAVMQAAALSLPVSWLAVRIAAGQLVPVLLLHSQRSRELPSVNSLLVIFGLVFAGELLGHHIFYASVLPYPLFP